MACAILEALDRSARSCASTSWVLDVLGRVQATDAGVSFVPPRRSRDASDPFEGAGSGFTSLSPRSLSVTRGGAQNCEGLRVARVGIASEATEEMVSSSKPVSHRRLGWTFPSTESTQLHTLVQMHLVFLRALTGETKQVQLDESVQLRAGDSPGSLGVPSLRYRGGRFLGIGHGSPTDRAVRGITELVKEAKKKAGTHQGKCRKRDRESNGRCRM